MPKEKKPKPSECDVCGTHIAQTHRGRPITKCQIHRYNPSQEKRSADALRAEAKKSKTRADALEAEILATRMVPPQAAEIEAAWRSRAMAVGLSLDSDPKKAAALVGLHDVDAEALALEAGGHEDLRQSRSSGIGRLLLAAIQLASIRLASTMQSIPPAQLSNAIKAAAQALELIQGSATPAYSEIRLVVNAPDKANIKAA